MARYGRDFGRDRWSGGGGYGQGGYGGGQSGGAMNRYGQEYGGMGSDSAQGGGSQAYGGHSGFGTGGGAYDNDFNAYGGYGYSGGQNQGGQNRGGQSGGYGSESGYSGYGYEGGFGGGRGGGGYGYGGGSSGGSGGFGGGQGYGGGAGYTGGGYGGGGQNYGGYGGGWTGGLSSGGDMERSYGGGSSFGGSSSSLSGGDELRRMRASDVMTDNPETVTPETSLAEAARKMRDLDVGIIPVVESASSTRLKGVLTDRDIAIRAVAEGKDSNSTQVMEVMTTEVETCNKNDSLRDVLNVMEREQVRRVPITDREGRLVGIIAQADVAMDVDSPQGQRHFADTVGEISEPGNPRRGWGGTSGGRSSQGRGGQGGGGLMGAVRSAVSSLGGSEASQRPGGGMQGGGTQGNNDPRAQNDPGSENV